MAHTTTRIPTEAPTTTMATATRNTTRRVVGINQVIGSAGSYYIDDWGLLIVSSDELDGHVWILNGCLIVYSSSW